MSDKSYVNSVFQSVQSEQREHQRHSANLPVHVFWQEESAGLIEASGLVRDVSAGGFGIELAKSLPIGQPILVETHAGALLGNVRHVRELADGYLVGLEILSASDGQDHQRASRNLNVVAMPASASR